MNKGLKKYIGSCCGNRFVILDCRCSNLDKKFKSNFASENVIKYGVDSALFIEKSKGFDIFMEIFEKDGSQSDSCGNGAILIASFLGLNDGMIKMKDSVAITEGNSKKQSILMNAEFSHTKEMGKKKNCLFVKIGEPHVVFLIDNINKFDLVGIGKSLQKKYSKGVNVDVIQKVNEFRYLIKTYERGVLAKTESCGTGSLSSYIAISYFYGKIYETPIEFKSAGGSHLVSMSNNMLKLEVLKKFCKIEELK